MKNKDEIILKIEKSKDANKQDSLTILIDDRAVFIPTAIITDFLKSQDKAITVIIPKE